MSMELLLIQNVLVRALNDGERNPKRSSIKLLVGSARSAKLNHKMCRNIFSWKLEMKLLTRKKLPQTQLCGRLVRSLSLLTQYQFRRQRLVKNEATGYPVSDGSSINGAQKGMLKSSINSPDWGNDIKEFQVSHAGGLYIDGGNSEGGQGHGGDGRDDGDSSDDYGGLEGSDGLIGLEWWWWWQWQQARQQNHISFNEHRMVQMITSELRTLMDMTISLGPSMLAAGELSRVFLLDQVFPAIMMLPVLPLIIVHLHLLINELFPMYFGALIALAAVLLLAVIWLLVRWNNREQHESDNDDNGE